MPERKLEETRTDPDAMVAAQQCGFIRQSHGCGTF